MGKYKCKSVGIIGSGIQFIVIDDNEMNMLPKDIDSRRVWDEIVDEFRYSDFLFVAFGNKGQNILSPDNLAIVWDLSKQFELKTKSPFFTKIKNRIAIEIQL